MSSERATATASVSTHVLDTSAGSPAADVSVQLSVRADRGADWTVHGTSRTDEDGRCKDFPALPEGTAHARLTFEVEPYLQSRSSTRRDAGRDSFFPEVTVVFAVNPGEAHHVPLLLNPFGYSVYRGS